MKDKGDKIYGVVGVVMVPDVHYSLQSQAAINTAFKLIKQFESHKVNLLGDYIDKDAVEHMKNREKEVK